MDKKMMKLAVKGSSVMATGGGGSLKEGLCLIRKIKSMKIDIVDINDLKNNDYIFSVFAVGSISNDDGIDKYVKNILAAKETLEKRLNIKFSAIIPVEIGPCSVAETFYLSCAMNIPVVDADVVGGRCSPEIYLESITMKNIKRSPIIVVGKNGIIAEINDNDPYTIEKALREFSIKEASYVYAVGYSMRISDIINIIPHGTISKACRIGKSKNIKEMKKIMGGCVIFKGSVYSENRKDAGGFFHGVMKIKGEGIYKGKLMDIFFKNENMVAYINGKLRAAFPDVISIVDKNNNGLCNSETKKGSIVAVILSDPPEIWKTAKAKEILSTTIGNYKSIPNK